MQAAALGGLMRLGSTLIPYAKRIIPLAKQFLPYLGGVILPFIKKSAKGLAKAVGGDAYVEGFNYLRKALTGAASRKAKRKFESTFPGLKVPEDSFSVSKSSSNNTGNSNTGLSDYTEEWTFQKPKRVKKTEMKAILGGNLSSVLGF